VKAGTSYSVSGWALINGTGNNTVRLVSKLACDGVADAYSWIQADDAVVPGTWTKLSGTFAIPAGCTVTDAAIYFEGTPAAYDVYLDDVSALAQ